LINKRSLAIVLAIFIAFTSVYAQPLSTKEVNLKNVAPQVSFTAIPQRRLDLIITTDYTGQKLANLQTAVNNLKAQLAALGVDVKESYVNSNVKVGSIKDYLRKYYRYAIYKYWWDYRYYVSSSGNSIIYPNFREQSSILWETVQCYETEENTLPVRNPVITDFYQSASDLYSQNSSGSQWSWWNEYTIKVANDVKSEGIFKVTYESGSAGSGQTKVGFHHDTVYVEKTFRPGDIVSSRTIDLSILDIDRIKNVSLREGSKRYLLLATDNLMSVGNFTTSLKQYLKDNDFAIKASINELTKDYLLTQEYFITDIFNVGEEIYYLTRTKRVIRTGTSKGEGSEFPIDVTDELGGVNDIKKFGDTIIFYFNNSDGTYNLKAKNDGLLVDIPVEHIKDMYYDIDKDIFFFYTINNEVYDYIPTSNSAKLLRSNMLKLITAGYNKVNRKFDWNDANLTALNGKYVYNVFYTKDYYYLIFAKDQNGVGNAYYTNNIYRGTLNIPNPVDAGCYYNTSYRINYALILTQSGDVYDFRYGQNPMSKLVTSNVPGLPSSNYDPFSRTIPTPVTVVPSTTNCKNEYRTKYSTFYEMPDGKVYYIGILNAGRTSGEDSYFYLNYTDLLETNINGIKKIVSYEYDIPTNYYGTYKCSMTYILDNSNNLHRYIDGWTGYDRIQHQLTYNVHTGVKDFAVVRSNTSELKENNLYVFLTDGRVLLNGANTGLTGVIKIAGYIPYANTGGELMPFVALKNDGYVTGIGGSLRYQLGVYQSNVTTWVNPIKSRITLDNSSKPYIRINDVIRDNHNSMYYEQGEYQKAINDIYAEMQTSFGGPQNYILVNELLNYSIIYSDYENDPEYQNRWFYTHDPNYFDNSNGIEPNAGIYISTPINPFTKVGKYEISLEARDNPKNDDNFDNYRLWSQKAKQTIYVHRKPIALQRITVTNNGNGTYTIKAYDAGSFDLDHSISRTDKGIVAREWRWKELEDTSWRYEQMNKSDCSPDKTYITQLRVKDVEGAWSDWNTIEIDQDNPPVALFNIEKQTIRTTELLKVKDLSFPQSFSTLTRWHWVVKKLNADGSVPAANIQNAQFSNSNTGTGSMAGYDINVKTDYSSNGPGKYRIYLRVKDSNGLWSDGGTDSITPADLSKYYSMDFEVINPNVAPSVSISKSPLFVYEGDDVRINILPTDADGDVLDIALYESTDGVNYSLVYSLNDSPSGVLRTYINENIGVGRYYYRVVVTDPYGLTAEASLNFVVHELGIMGYVNHTTLWNEHRIDYNIAKSGTSNSPRPYSVFFPGERFMLAADITEIDSQSSVYADSVSCSIVGTSYSDTLSSSGPNSWEGSIWDEDMIYWSNQPLDFRFTVVYRNSADPTFYVEKVYVVRVDIVDDEFWRQHLRF